ncbi:hypothetical protein [Ovoidimarina sediminis]|uniref:hypothetical protein n=1 Tax=Ovoidimarina sediminis TaxID=3079856 RepID=UPI0029117C23|nr:hypothetical protein [Rhodophyticola sp. MJ-SS7]MDU8942719.1 hypothetical protein [Rhodophyticola sp. MJ-SS7]
MVGASKILTVSYGTFSCTLEGFDDPFSTMRGIAEYFRDLAADDRYFGAEPPTPDAEMLHRIAQAEVERRVEARVSDEGIVLRQVEKQPDPQPAPSAKQPAPEAYADDDDNMFADLGDADDEAEATSAAFASPARDSSVAAKLSRIRAVVSGNAEAQKAEFSGPIEDAFADIGEDEDDNLARALADDIGAEPGASETAEVAAEAEPVPAPEPELEPEPEAEAEPVAAAEPEHGAPVAEAAPEETPLEETPLAETPAEPAPYAGPFGETPIDPYAAAPAAPAAVQPAAYEMPAYDMPAAAESDLTHAADMSAATEAEEAADLMALDGMGAAAQDEAETLATAEEEANLWAEPADAFAPVSEDAAGDDADDDPAFGAELSAADEDDDDDGPRLDDEKLGLAARIIQLKRAAMGDDTAIHAAEDEDDDEDLDDIRTPVARDITLMDDDEFDSVFAEADDADDDDTGMAASEDDLDDDFDAEDDDDDDDSNKLEAGLDIDFDLDDPYAPEEPAAATPDEAVEDDDMAATPAAQGRDGLAAMIAEAVTGRDDDADEDEDEDDADDAPEGDGAQRLATFEPEKTGEAAFDRILEQTNSRMDDSEGNRRRSAIAHLKAAVAATKADRLMKRKRQPEEEAAEEQSQYRDDLAQVVRPRRAEAGDDATRDARPEIAEAPSPLVLVSEQRVDADDIAPRRVSSETIDPELEAEANGGFRAFAEKMGATELPDLLEAAAAYSAFVEGQREFSRPQLMRRVAHVEPGGEGFTREAGLRSFGQLLRQGKIQKLKRGQFTITEDTRFNPEARIAGE